MRTTDTQRACPVKDDLADLLSRTLCKNAHATPRKCTAWSLKNLTLNVGIEGDQKGGLPSRVFPIANATVVEPEKAARSTRRAIHD